MMNCILFIILAPLLIISSKNHREALAVITKSPISCHDAIKAKTNAFYEVEDGDYGPYDCGYAHDEPIPDNEDNRYDISTIKEFLKKLFSGKSNG